MPSMSRASPIRKRSPGPQPAHDRRPDKHPFVATRLILELNGPQTAAFNRIMGGNRDHLDDSQRQEAIGRVLLEYDEELRKRSHQSAQAARSLQKLRDELDTARNELNEVKNELRNFEHTLKAERKTRIRIREKLTAVRRRLDNTVGSARRLRASREKYRSLVARVEAAILHTAPRKDFAGLEARLTRALRSAGFELPAPAPQDAEPRP